MDRRARLLAVLSIMAGQILSQCKVLHAFPFYQSESGAAGPLTEAGANHDTSG